MLEKISIIVPVYNVASYVEATIKSLIEQDYQDYEILLVDDGSTDGSGIICDRYAMNNENIRVIHKKNGGVSSARNKGLELATGTYIVFVDSDDYVSIRYISDLYHDIQYYDADMVIHMYSTKFPNGKEEKNMKVNLDCVMGGRRFIEYQIAGGRDTSVYAKIFQKKIIDRKKIRFNEKITNLEDMLFLFEYAISCNKIVYSSKNNYCRIARENGCVYSEFNLNKLSALRVFDYIDKQLKIYRDTQNIIRKNDENKFCNIINFMLETMNNSSYKNCYNQLYMDAKNMIRDSDIGVKNRFKYYFISSMPSLYGWIYRKKCKKINEQFKKKRILFVQNIPSPYRVEFFSLLANYYDLTVIYENDHATNRDKLWENADTTNKYKKVYLNPWIRIRGSDSFSFWVYFYIIVLKYDAVILGSHGSPTQRMLVLFLRILKKKYFYNLDGDLFSRIKNESYLKYQIKSKLLFSGADAYLTTGENSKRVLEHYGVHSNKIYIYPFTSIHDYDVLEKPVTNAEREVIRKKIGIDGENIILSVGMICLDKGYDLLMQVGDDFLPNTSIYIIGGKITKEFIDIQNKFPSTTKFYFIEFKQKDELKDYFMMADIFILPTKKDSWGLVVNEALGYGLPIITTNRCNAGLEMIKNGVNGYIVDIDYPKQFALYANKILSDKMLAGNMRTANLLRAHQYTLEKMSERHKEIIDEVLNN